MKTFTVEAVHGKNSIETHRPEYAKEMHPRISEMEFGKFMRQFMPGPDMPAELASEIPEMNTRVLLGNTEANICDELVRVSVLFAKLFLTRWLRAV